MAGLPRRRGGVDGADVSPNLAPLLSDGWVLYGEWLWLRHGVTYDAAPDWLIALDLWNPDRGFAALADRDERRATAGLALPPTVFTGGARRPLDPGRPDRRLLLRHGSGGRGGGGAPG